MRTIYFDYNATTPLDPQVRDAMVPFLGEIYGNPSSIHHIGRRARAFLDEAHERTAAVLHCKPSEIVFTSGGTESNNLAIFGAARLLRSKGKHLITSAVEHHAVLHPMEYLAKHEGFELTVLPVDSVGRIDPSDLKKALRPDTILVSLQAANNEIGTIQPIAELGRRCRERGVIFHTDAVQWFGKLPVEAVGLFEADLVSLCAHKFHGPKGVGALYVRSPFQPHALLVGGGHENERRAGTENVPGIAGGVDALERFVGHPVFSADLLSPLITRLRQAIEELRPLGVTLRSPQIDVLPNTIAFTVERSESVTLLAGLDLEGICASSGSACSAGSLEPSHVIQALAPDSRDGRALVRFSLGRESTSLEVETVCSVLPDLIRRAQTRE